MFAKVPVHSTLILLAALLSAGSTLADTTPPPAQPAADPLTKELAPCAEGKDPAARAVACTALITGGRLTGKPLGAAYLFRGKAQAQRNELKSAIDDFSQALKIDGEATDALYNRAAAYALMGRADLALADFDHLLELAPDDADTLFYRAQIYAQQDKVEAAITDLSTVLKLKPDDFESRLQRAGLSIALGRNDDGIGDLTLLLEATPNAPAALYNRGRAEYLKGDYPAAAKDFAAAMKNRDGNPYAALRLYLAKARTGKVDPTPLEAAAKAFPTDQWPLPIVAFYLGKIDETELISNSKVNDRRAAANLAAETQYYLGQWALLRNDSTAARKHFEAAIAVPEAKVDLEFIDARLELKRLAP